MIEPGHLIKRDDVLKAAHMTLHENYIEFNDGASEQVNRELKWREIRIRVMLKK